jgi:hypothetical protein
MPSTNIRVDLSTHRAIENLAQDLRIRKAEVIRLAVRKLLQKQMGVALASPLTPHESSWLGANTH